MLGPFNFSLCFCQLSGTNASKRFQDVVTMLMLMLMLGPTNCGDSWVLEVKCRNSYFHRNSATLPKVVLKLIRDLYFLLWLLLQIAIYIKIQCLQKNTIQEIYLKIQGRPEEGSLKDVEVNNGHLKYCKWTEVLLDEKLEPTTFFDKSA